MRSSIWKKGLICLSAVMLLECPVGALPGTAYTAKAEETDDKTDTSNIKSILLIGQDKREGQSRQRSESEGLKCFFHCRSCEGCTSSCYYRSVFHRDHRICYGCDEYWNW